MLQEALATSPITPEAFDFLADAAEKAGHPLVARDALLDLDALQGDTAPAPVRQARTRRIGALSVAGNDPRTALPFLTAAIAAVPGDTAALGLLARARWETGDRDGARSALAYALTLAPADAALTRLARTIR
jgi:predicted Zn-dependent protease